MTEETDITVRTKLYRTESREKVEEAVCNLFPDAEFEDERGSAGEKRDEDIEIVAEAGEKSVERLRELGASVREMKKEEIGPVTEVWTVMEDPEGNGFCVTER